MKARKIAMFTICMAFLLAGCSNVSRETDDVIPENVITEEAKESEIEETVSYESWQEAYKDFLLSYEPQEYGEQEYSPHFDLVYVDEDDIPELVIADDAKKLFSTHVYAFYEGKTVLINDYSEFGVFSYVPKENLIHSSWDKNGNIYDSFHKIENGEDVTLASFSWMDADLEVSFYIGEQEVSEKEYREQLAIYEDSYEFISFSYDDIYEITEENIDRIFKAENPFFYTQELTCLTADVKYLDIELSVVRSGKLNIQWLKNYENGSLFKMSVTPLENMEFTLGEERLNIYFYVTVDEIYRLWSYVDQDGETIEFYNDDALLMEILDTDEKLIENGELVCCKENIEDETDSAEPGKHVTIHQNENRITYNRVDIMSNGSRYFYETFVWEEGKGLVEYKSGYKQEADILYIDNIERKEEESWLSDITKDYQENEYMKYPISSVYFLEKDGYGYELVIAVKKEKEPDKKDIKIFVSKLEGEEYQLQQVLQNKEGEDGHNYGNGMPGGGLYLVDANFDGMDDILVHNGDWGDRGNSFYSCFLYNGEEYELCESFNGIPNPQVDTKRKQILAYESDWGCQYFEIYVFENGRFYEEKRLYWKTVYNEALEGEDPWTDEYCETIFKQQINSDGTIRWETVSEEEFSEEENGKEYVDKKLRGEDSYWQFDLRDYEWGNLGELIVE